MKVLNFKNCCVSGGLAGCMTIIVMLLGAAFLYTEWKEREDSLKLNLGSNNGVSLDIEQRSHLKPISDAEIAFKTLLISDSENDWESTKKAFISVDEENIDLLVHLGDITHLGVLNNLKDAESVLHKSGIEFYAVPGDRDLWKSDGIENFNKTFGDSYGLLEKEGFKILLIDNSNEYEGIDPNQWKLIEDNISDVDFVMLHNPIYRTGSLLGYKGMGQYSEDVDNQRLELLELIHNSDVKAVFAGDQHVFSENFDRDDDVLNHYVIASINKERSITPGFAILTVYKNGDYYIEKRIVN